MSKNSKYTRTQPKDLGPINPSLDISHISDNYQRNDILQQNPNPPLANLYNHNAYVIDTDVEKFRIRLEDMLNRFKLESMTEIIETKKNLLLDQHKYIAAEKLVQMETVSDLTKEVI